METSFQRIATIVAAVSFALSLVYFVPVRSLGVTTTVSTYPFQGFGLVMFCLGVIFAVTAAATGLNRRLLHGALRAVADNAGLALSMTGAALAVAGFALTRWCTYPASSFNCLAFGYESHGYVAMGLGVVLFAGGLVVTHERPPLGIGILAVLLILAALSLAWLTGTMSVGGGLGAGGWDTGDLTGMAYLLAGATLLMSASGLLAIKRWAWLFAVVSAGVSFGLTVPMGLYAILCIAEPQCSFSWVGPWPLVSLGLAAASLGTAVTQFRFFGGEPRGPAPPTGLDRPA